MKTGADLSGVVAWNYENSRQILEARRPVPALLHHRLSVDYAAKENRPPLPLASKGHWLDRLEQGVQVHIRVMVQQRDELVARAMPPTLLFESVAEEPEAVALGAKLNQRWAAALNRRVEQDADFSYGPFDWARRAAEDYLTHFPPERRGAILRGALVSVYGGEERAGQRPASDGAMWPAEGKEGTGSEVWGLGGVGNWTIRALRDIGVLDEVMETEERLVVYPNVARDP